MVYKARGILVGEKRKRERERKGFENKWRVSPFIQTPSGHDSRDQRVNVHECENAHS